MQSESVESRQIGSPESNPPFVDRVPQSESHDSGQSGTPDNIAFAENRLASLLEEPCDYSPRGALLREPLIYSPALAQAAACF
jgi:hypothetical protein